MTAGNFKNEKQVGQKRAKNMNVLQIKIKEIKLKKMFGKFRKKYQEKNNGASLLQ